MNIGHYQLESNLILAPMAGVTDKPFRALCLAHGAGLAISEMMSSNPKVWNTTKSQQRMVHKSEPGIRSVQIAGSDPQLMAQAAQFNVEHGAQIIDINMGCPAKKVNKKLAGSALLQYPERIEQILTEVVNAVDVPVTLKTRTGWDLEHKNCVTVAKIAEQCGIQAIALHGRTRACLYKGYAEYDSIRAVKQVVSIPVIANGDIDTPEKAKFVLDYTGADALMIGRPAQGRPWIFNQIQHYLATGKHLPLISNEEVARILLAHVTALHHFYGDFLGPRIARKHVGWYLSAQSDVQRVGLSNRDVQGKVQERTTCDTKAFRRRFNAIESANDQLIALTDYFE